MWNYNCWRMQLVPCHLLPMAGNAARAEDSEDKNAGQQHAVPAVAVHNDDVHARRGGDSQFLLDGLDI